MIVRRGLISVPVGGLGMAYLGVVYIERNMNMILAA
jgi:hypothetical protein